jgi:co-chaperonin GroES (HSP10)
MNDKVELTPPNGKVIIRKDEPPRKTESGIHLRARDRIQSMTGTVVSSSTNSYAFGDRIFFNPQISATVNFKGENLVVIFEDDIMAKIC